MNVTSLKHYQFGDTDFCKQIAKDDILLFRRGSDRSVRITWRIGKIRSGETIRWRWAAVGVEEQKAIIFW